VAEITLDQIPDIVEAGKDSLTAHAALMALREIQAATPVDTGLLLSGWRLKVDAKGFEITNGIEYAPYVEERRNMLSAGTSRLPSAVMEFRAGELSEAADKKRVVAVQVLEAMRDATPVQTGRLRAGWRLKIDVDGFEVFNSVAYSPYVDEARNITGAGRAEYRRGTDG